MNIDNPFESGHIKNYILLYVSVVVIMILFFVASTLFNDVEKVEKKVFDINVSEAKESKKQMKNIDKIDSSEFKLMEKAY
jgi:hypothetical protein